MQNAAAQIAVQWGPHNGTQLGTEPPCKKKWHRQLLKPSVQSNNTLFLNKNRKHEKDVNLICIRKFRFWNQLYIQDSKLKHNDTLVLLENTY